MAIVGLTTNEDGTPRIHRTVNCKVCIGLAPDENSNYPKKLDHFAFLKMEMVDKDMKWVVDKEKQDHFGAECKSVWIILMSNEAEDVFRTELAAYVKTRCWCRGDGEKAMRREKIDGKYTGDFKIWNGPCGNHGCPDFESQNGKPAVCKPSADLYFILQDFPTLGTICRIHTSSYQSIRQISSALRDLQAVTGGRLMGIACKLFVMPAKSTFTQGGVEKSGTKYVLGLELAAKDMPMLMESMAKTAGMFQGLQKQLNGATLDVEEDDDERAGEIAEEFYPPVIEAESDPEAALRARADELLQEFYPEMNTAQRLAAIGKYKGKMQEMVNKITQNGKGGSCPATSPKTQPETSRQSSAAGEYGAASSAANRQPNSATSQPETERPATRRSAQPAPFTPQETPTSAQPINGNVHGLDVSDDDFPEGMFPNLEPGKKPEPETKPKPEAAKNGGRRGFSF